MSSESVSQSVTIISARDAGASENASQTEYRLGIQIKEALNKQYNIRRLLTPPQ